MHSHVLRVWQKHRQKERSLRAQYRDSGDGALMVGQTTDRTFEREAHVAQLSSSGGAWAVPLGGEDKNALPKI